MRYPQSLILTLIALAYAASTNAADFEWAALNIERCEWFYVTGIGQTSGAERKFKEKYGKDWAPIQVSSRSKAGTREIYGRYTLDAAGEFISFAGDKDFALAGATYKHDPSEGAPRTYKCHKGCGREAPKKVYLMQTYDGPANPAYQRDLDVAKKNCPSVLGNIGHQ